MDQIQITYLTTKVLQILPIQIWNMFLILPF